MRRRRPGHRGHSAWRTALGLLAAATALAGDAACSRNDAERRAAQGGAPETGAAVADSQPPAADASAAAAAAAAAAPDSAASTTTPGHSTASAGEEATGASGPLGDPNIFALLEQTNRSAIETGRLAERRAASAEVKAFARDMVREHAAFQEESDRLAHDLAVIPQLPLNEGTTLQAAATRTALTGARGAAFDRAYLDAEVTQHESTLQLLQRSSTAAENARLRAMLEAAIPTVQAHLDRAKALRRKLGASAG